jgi:DNA-binding protein H-NS
MPNVNLSGMTVEALMDLRQQVDEALLKRRAELETQLERVDKAIAMVGRRNTGSVLKGKTVPPKYRGPAGETWAGRGARPRCLLLR